MRCSRSRFVLSRVIPNTIPSVCWANTEEGKAILAANLPGSTKPRVHLIDGNRAVPVASLPPSALISRWRAGLRDLRDPSIDFPMVRAVTSIPAPLGALVQTLSAGIMNVGVTKCCRLVERTIG